MLKSIKQYLVSKERGDVAWQIGRAFFYYNCYWKNRIIDNWKYAHLWRCEAIDADIDDIKKLIPMLLLPQITEEYNIWAVITYAFLGVNLYELEKIWRLGYLDEFKYPVDFSRVFIEDK